MVFDTSIVMQPPTFHCIECNKPITRGARKCADCFREGLLKPVKSKRKFPYTSIYSKEYLEDRDKLFEEHGNGWWYTYGFIDFKSRYIDGRYKKKIEINKTN